jgi:excinuclease ABC subunit B
LEFLARVPQAIYVSATPDNWELSQSGAAVEQLIRPTGVTDPAIDIRPSRGQIQDLVREIKRRAAKKQRVLVTTLTKRNSEALAEHLQGLSLKVQYLHSDVKTLERSDILADLRAGHYDVLVGINLLREGLDLPEVALVAILDADKEGFLRSATALIQTMGRAARHLNGRVIMYADKITGSMAQAISEVERRRKIQLDYNRKHQVKPRSISKPIRERLLKPAPEISEPKFNPDALTADDKEKLKKQIKKKMLQAARVLNFELAQKLKDQYGQLD